MSKEKMSSEEMQVRDDMRYVMATESGRCFVFRLLTQCGVYRSIASSGYKTNEAFIQMGRREQGLQVLSEASKYAPGSFQLMIKENNDG